MNLTRLYPVTEIETGAEDFVFEFTSSGPNGKILKRVQYEPLYYPAYPNAYHLTFGDVNEADEVDFTVRSNNGDVYLVLATVISTLFQFFRYLPNSPVLFKGADPALSHLYQSLAVLQGHEVASMLQVRSIVGDEEQEVRADTGLTYEVFLIRFVHT